MSDSECYPEADFFRKPNFPTFANCGFNTRHDNREVTLIEFLESRICPNIYRMFRSVDWTHDMIIVKWHFFIFIHLTRAETLRSDKCAPQVQSTQTGQWLSTLFHANCSAAQVYVLYPRQFIFVPSCRNDHSWRYYDSLSAKKDTLKKFFISNDDKCYGENMS